MSFLRCDTLTTAQVWPCAYRSTGNVWQVGSIEKTPSKPNNPVFFLELHMVKSQHTAWEWFAKQ